MPIILDGRAVARHTYERLRDAVSLLSEVPKLSVFLVGDDPASLSYIAQKRKYAEWIGMDFELVRFSADVEESLLLTALDRANRDPSVSGIIVQLPLPERFHPARITALIAPEKDVDGFTPTSIGNLFLGRDEWTSCTPKGIMRLLRHYGRDVAGKRVVVLGRSNIVGKPLALLLINAGATVVSCNSRTPDVASFTREADIVIVAIGKPGYLTADMVRPGATVIDVGFSVVDGAIRGDADFAALSPVCDITPVPGGVGAMTVAMLLENTYLAHCRANGVPPADLS